MLKVEMRAAARVPVMSLTDTPIAVWTITDQR
jgi:hypothetical protein